MTAFPPRLRLMTRVERWGIIPVLWPDKVASHSWFVAVYANQIARLIDWRGDRGQLLTAAIMHDIDEIITGEITSPVKRAIVNSKAREAYVVDRAAAELPGFPVGPSSIWPDDIRAILDCADVLDALLYATMEVTFGNGAFRPRVSGIRTELAEQWTKLPASEPVRDVAWRQVVQSVFAHEAAENFDIST